MYTLHTNHKSVKTQTYKFQSVEQSSHTTFGRFYPHLYIFWSLFRNKKVSFVYQTKETFLRDAFLAERDAHCVRDTDFVCDARLRRV